MNGDDDDNFEPNLNDMRVAIDGLDRSDEDWPDLHWMVANRLHDRYNETRDYDDLENAIRRAQLIVDDYHPNDPEYLTDFALMVWSKFEVVRSDELLAECIHLWERALAHIYEDDDCFLRAHTQTNLAVGLMSRRADGDEQRAASLWKQAATCDDLDVDVLAQVLANLAETLSLDDSPLADLVDAVDNARRATSLPVEDRGVLAQAWMSLANSLDRLHDLRPEPELIVEAISASERALSYLDADNDDWPRLTANLCGLLRQRSREAGSAQHLERAWALIQEVLDAGIDDHPDFAYVHISAASVASDLGYETVDKQLVRRSLDLYRTGTAAQEVTAEDAGIGLSTFSAALRDAGEMFDDAGLLGDAVDAGEKALRILTKPGLRRAAALTMTANALRSRFVVARSLADLDLAFNYTTQSLDSTPEEHREYAARQTNLAVILSDNFDERAVLADLDRAIELYREALTRPEPIGMRICERQNDLALALRARFESTLNIDDLEEAITESHKAVDATDRQSLLWPGFASNLGNALAEDSKASHASPISPTRSRCLSRLSYWPKVDRQNSRATRRTSAFLSPRRRTTRHRRHCSMRASNGWSLLSRYSRKIMGTGHFAKPISQTCTFNGPRSGRSRGGHLLPPPTSRGPSMLLMRRLPLRGIAGLAFCRPWRITPGLCAYCTASIRPPQRWKTF
ncbi:hypothetical protein [Williamsia sp. 1135]|uniref:hypothetical protein n=1 Tax=Williamsia sp. 1135 TaxID=1889262 RepID=UPI000A11AA1F|nr:hypothetical protein [Williamsia sp. 1135]ORM37386.1 hypothetical protein BFL43_04305 [Williamsia sp. 1135]